MRRYRWLLLGLLSALVLGIGSGRAGLARLRLDLALLRCLHDAGGPTGVCRRVPDNSDERARYHRGVNALRAGVPSQAVTLLTKYVATNPEDRAAQLYLGLAYWQEGDRVAAMSVWRKAEAAPYFVHRGSASQNPDDIEMAIAIGPVTPEMYFALGDIQWSLAQFSEAIMAYENYLALTPARSVNYWLAQARIAERRSGFDVALQAYQNAIRTEPRSSQIYYRRAKVYERGGRLDDAAGEYRAILALVPTEEEASIGLSEVLARQDRIEDAVAVLRQARRLRPSSPRLTLQLGIVLMQHNNAEADIYLKDAVRLTPDSFWCRVYLAENELRLGRAPEALANAQRASQLATAADRESAWVILGRSHEAVADRESARLAYHHALKINPQNKVALERLLALGERS